MINFQKRKRDDCADNATHEGNGSPRASGSGMGNNGVYRQARDVFSQRRTAPNFTSSDSDLPSIPSLSDTERDATQVMPIDVMGNSSRAATSGPKKRQKLSKKKEKKTDSPKRRPQWRQDSLHALVHAGTEEKSVTKAKFKGASGSRVQKRLAWERVAGMYLSSHITLTENF